MPAPLLAIEGLSVGFPSPHGDVFPVDDVALSLEAGEVLGLVGESGAGKSLTGAALAGLVPAPGRILAGTTTIAGRRIDMRDAGQLSSLRGTTVSMIFQDPLAALDPLMRIGDQLVETIRHARGLAPREARSLAVELLASTGLPDPGMQMLRYPHQLSGGMRQRVVIALATAPAPRVLVADEPTTALDVRTQARILALLRRLADDEGAAILIVSHDLGVIASIADRTAVLYAGRIVESGPTAALVRTPRHPYTRGLIDSVPSAHGPKALLAPIPGSPPHPGALPAGCAFHPRCPDRIDRCASERPPLARQADRDIACWLHPQDAPDASP